MNVLSQLKASLVRPVTMEIQKFKFPKISAKLCLNRRLWTQFGNFPFYFSRISGKKTTSRGDLDQHRPEKFSSRYWIRRGVTSCSPHTSFDEISDSVVNSERGELVRGSDPPLVYSAHSTASDLWRAPFRLLLKSHLAAGV